VIIHLVRERVIETVRPKPIHELVNSAKSEDVVLITAGSDYYEAVVDDLDKIDTSKDLPKLAIVGIQRINEHYTPDIPKKIHLFVKAYSSGS